MQDSVLCFVNSAGIYYPQDKFPGLKDHPLWPVQAIINSFQCATNVDPEGPVFMTRDKSDKPIPLYYKDFVVHIRSILGPDGNNYTGHRGASVV